MANAKTLFAGIPQYAAPSAKYRRDAGQRLVNILTDGRNTRDGGRADGVLVCDTVPLPRAWMRLESAVARDRALLSHFFRPRLARVPNVDCADENRCALTKGRWAIKWQDRCLTSAFSRIFEATAAVSRPDVPSVTLSRFDLWHGHLVWNSPTERLVFLLHAREYPKMSPDFPVDLGWCQVGSPLAYSKLAMLRRNFLFARCQDGSGRLACLDLMEERCLRALVHPDLAPLGTTWEGDFGDPLCTIVYLKPRGKGHGVLLLD